jgi:hypothetical protein
MRSAEAGCVLRNGDGSLFSAAIILFQRLIDSCDSSNEARRLAQQNEALREELRSFARSAT